MWLYLILQVISQLCSHQYRSCWEHTSRASIDILSLGHDDDHILGSTTPKRKNPTKREYERISSAMHFIFYFSSSSKYMSQLYLTEKVDTAQKDQPRDILHCGFSDYLYLKYSFFCRQLVDLKFSKPSIVQSHSVWLLAFLHAGHLTCSLFLSLPLWPIISFSHLPVG
jgi:hypothetical protein